jgi:cell wall-associated NlpC family hydrolase
MALSGKSVAAISVGGLLVWSGIKGWSLLGTVQDVLTGAKPSGTIAHPLDPTIFASKVGDVAGTAAGVLDPGGTVGGLAGLGASSIAQTALQYQGHAYKYGGAPGANGNGPWDCSSFVNYVIGVRLGMSIPGYKPGTYKGTVHGPPTGTWAIWPGYASVKRADVVAGDIVVWTGHMGIAISNTQMISALNESAGTKIGQIDGAARGPIVRVGRYG